MISVVLPVYNGDQYLYKAINSVLTQDVDLELIIVDDGSTDLSHNIAECFRRIDTRVRLISHEINYGLPAALNTGFNAARGSLFTWTSHDNLYMPGALRTMQDRLDITGADIVYAGCLWFSDSRPSWVRPANHPKYMPEYNVVHACFLHRRNVYDYLGGYDEELFRAEDWEFWLRAYAAGFRFDALPEVLYYCRDHPGSLTRSTKAACIEAARRCFRKNIARLPVSPWRRLRAEAINLAFRYVWT
jgi:glycosyltransferase involved in cell wall biosynthesis